MARYKKKPTVVDAFQATCTDNFGFLGSLSCTDWIIVGSDGSFTTMDNTDFPAKYERTNDNAELTGSDYD